MAHDTNSGDEKHSHVELAGLTLNELTSLYDKEKRKLFTLRGAQTLHTKKYHLKKTSTGNIHAGILLIPATAVGVSQQATHSSHISWWHDPMLNSINIQGLTLLATYGLYLPIGVLDSYQRICRLKFLLETLSHQQYLLDILTAINQKPDASKQYKSIFQFESAFYQRLIYDRNRHVGHVVLNTLKLVAATSAVVVQSLNFSSVINSVSFFAVLGSSVGFPFIFVGLTILACCVDMYYAVKKLQHSSTELKYAKLAFENTVEPERLQFRQKAYENAIDRNDKRKKKVIYRASLVMAAVCVCLPTFGVPAIIAAAAGIISLIAMNLYAWYQKCQHKHKKNKALMPVAV